MLFFVYVSVVDTRVWNIVLKCIPSEGNASWPKELLTRLG